MLLSGVWLMVFIVSCKSLWQQKITTVIASCFMSFLPAQYLYVPVKFAAGTPFYPLNHPSDKANRAIIIDDFF
jgi:hypothetical protein